MNVKALTRERDEAIAKIALIEALRDHAPRTPDDERAWIPVLMDVTVQLDQARLEVERLREALREALELLLAREHEGLSPQMNGSHRRRGESFLRDAKKVLHAALAPDASGESEASQ